MPEPGRRRLPSLRARLLWSLLLPLVMLVGLGAALDYRSASALTCTSHDRALVGLALGVAARLETDHDSDLPTHLVALIGSMNRFDPVDHLYYLVEDERGRAISGDAALSALGRQRGEHNPLLLDANVQQQPVRAAVYAYDGPDGHATIVVAETLHRRAAEVRQALLTAAAGNAATALAALVGALIAIGFALGPLHELGQGIERHDTSELRPVLLRRVPREVTPLVRALNRLMQRLRSAVRARQDFINHTAHQLRTPLAGLTAQAELLEQEPLTPEAARRAGEVAHAARRLSRLVQQLLSLARADADAGRFVPMGEVGLPDVLQETASACLDEALAQGIDLGFEPQPATVHGSAWMLRELLVNLVANAITHTPTGTEVTVACGRNRAGRPFLEVRDDGPGIPVADRERVFQRYVRLSEQDRQGTGLGLAIVREIARHHGAAVSLDDGPGGRGLRVCVEFPA